MREWIPARTVPRACKEFVILKPELVKMSGYTSAKQHS